MDFSKCDWNRDSFTECKRYYIEYGASEFIYDDYGELWYLDNSEGERPIYENPQLWIILLIVAVGIIVWMNMKRK